MTHLWSPWRKNYVKRKGAPSDGCVFCDIAASHSREHPHVVARSSRTFALLNRYPYTFGHTMVIPYAHTPSQEDMSPAALTDLMIMTNRVITVLRETTGAPAYNIGANIGAAAGAGIAGHYHFHVVPRWPGDANFMTTIGGARTIPGTLNSAARQLREAWAKLYDIKRGSGE